VETELRKGRFTLGSGGRLSKLDIDSPFGYFGLIELLRGLLSVAQIGKLDEAIAERTGATGDDLDLVSVCTEERRQGRPIDQHVTARGVLPDSFRVPGREQ
jgi:hypothetical protein